MAKADKVTKEDGSLDLSQVPEAVRPALELIYKSNQELVKKNDQLAKQITDRDARDTDKEIVAKADTFTHIGIPREDVVAQLKDARSISTASYERVCKSFETLNTQAKESKLFTEIGSGMGGSTGGDSWGRIEKAAEAVVAKSGEKVTKAESVENFLKTTEGQRMYADYKKERGGI